MKLGALGLVLTLFLVVDAMAAQLTVSWFDNSGSTAGFSLERRTSSSSVYSVVASLPVGVTSWVDATVLSGSTYCYRVRAVKSGLTSAYSNEACKMPGTGLTVVKAGTGTGTVVSSPAGINCGTVCSAAFSASTAVTLTATPSSGSSFTGWSGGGCAGTASCTLATNVGTTVTATFTKLSTSPSTAGLTVAYKGKLRDRVGTGNTSRTADGALDGVLTGTLRATGGRTITSLTLSSSAGGHWDTNIGTSIRLLGAAMSLDGALLNNSTTMAVNFAVADGGTFYLFASDTASAHFASGRTLMLSARFSDGTSITASARVP